MVQQLEINRRAVLGALAGGFATLSFAGCGQSGVDPNKDKFMSLADEPMGVSIRVQVMKGVGPKASSSQDQVRSIAILFQPGSYAVDFYRADSIGELKAVSSEKFVVKSAEEKEVIVPEEKVPLEAAHVHITKISESGEMSTRIFSLSKAQVTTGK